MDEHQQFELFSRQHGVQTLSPCREVKFQGSDPAQNQNKTKTSYNCSSYVRQYQRFANDAIRERISLQLGTPAGAKKAGIRHSYGGDCHCMVIENSQFFAFSRVLSTWRGWGRMRGLFCLVLLAAILGSNAAQASGDVYRMIAAAANRHGISASLAIKVVKIESDFDCTAEGSAGELGPLQIKPATARLIGYQGLISALQSCGAGLEWGMKHLAMAIRAGGVWKHNQGLWAKVKSANAAAYEQKVMDVRLADFDHPSSKAATAKIEFASPEFRGGHPFP
jgi:transglycosylase-like protein with SLT domain